MQQRDCPGHKTCCLAQHCFAETANLYANKKHAVSKSVGSQSGEYGCIDLLAKSCLMTPELPQRNNSALRTAKSHSHTHI